MVNVCVDPEVFKVENGQMGMVHKAFGARLIKAYRVGDKDKTFKKADYPRAARFLVQVQGGGGGSAGAVARAGHTVTRAGGSGGAYAEALFSYDQVPDKVAITVGGGGAGGVRNADGGDGGESKFGSLLTAVGGVGSAADAMKTGTTKAAHGGTPARNVDENAPGALRIGGGAGGGCFRINGSQGLSGDGGAAMLGRGGSAFAVDEADAGEGFGGGAGGATAKDGRTVNGAAGRPGIVLVWVFAG